MKTLNHRRGMVAALAAAVLLLAAPAEGKARRKRPARSKAPAACAAAYKDSLLLEQDGQLMAARAKLQLCARRACGSVVHRCSSRLARVEANLPTIVPAATDDAGRSIAETEVSMDGKPLLSRVDGRSLTVDPGPHEFVFETAGTPPATVKVDIPVGRRNQPIAAVLHVPDGNPTREEPARAAPTVAPASAPPPAPVVKPVVKEPEPEEPPPVARALRTRTPREPERSGSSSVAPTLLTVVGVAGLAGGGALTYWGRKDNQQLAGCSPDCPAETVHHIRMLYLGADMSFAVGGLALGTAALLWLTSGPSTPHEERVASSHLGVGVSPTRSGAVASVGGAF
jgi:hypothetical protein